jgi:hypothetical protein
MKADNFLPLLQLPTKKTIQSIHICSTIPFGELVTFLMITSNVRLSRRDATKYLFAGLFFRRHHNSWRCRAGYFGAGKHYGAF